MLATLALVSALATSPPLLKKAAPDVMATPSAAPLLKKAAPAPRPGGYAPVRTFTSSGSSNNTRAVGKMTTVGGGGWGWFGIFGVIGLAGFWRGLKER